MARKWLKRVFAGLLVAVTIAACDEWTLWDDMFKRNVVPGPNARGWTGGDGAFSAPLPSNRVAWFFGDSPVTSWSSQGLRTQLGQDDFLLYSVYGNTVAVQNDRLNPSASSINFYARSANTQCVDTGIANITSEPLSNGNYKQYFNHKMLGLPEPVHPACKFLWPVGAECLNCNSATNARLLIAFYEWEGCEVGTAGCSLLGTRATGNVIARFKNLGDAPKPNPSIPGSGWQRDGKTLHIPRNNNSIFYGFSFMKENSDGKIYIYAQAPGTDLLFVARAPEATVLDGVWEGWRTSNFSGLWSTNGSLPLRAVANEVPGGAFSVDKVTRSGITSYLLVHSRPLLNHHLYARTTIGITNVNGQNTAATWSDAQASTPRIDLSTIDSSLGWHMLDLINREECENLTGGNSAAPNWRAVCPDPPLPCPNPRWVCGVSYHGQAHVETAITDANGPVYIPASYIVPNGPNPFFDPMQEEGLFNPRLSGGDARYYRPKFTALEVAKLAPWCSGSSCWEGIVKEWPRRQIGGTSASFWIDLRSANKIWAQVTRTAGTATMDIQFWNGLTQISSTTCTVAHPTVTCNNTPKPPLVTWASVNVRGVATDEFKLRVHHKGTY